MLLRVAQSPAKLNSQQKEGVGMRIVFMGTPAFAATILDQLVQAYDVVGVFRSPMRSVRAERSSNQAP